MSSGLTQTVISNTGLTTWPMLLDLSRDDCKRSLRSIELQAYASVVSAFRAQGDLTQDKKKALQDLQRLLSISTERHRAEVRRAVNDEKLATIADHVSGPSVTCDWLIEGRRLVPLMPRLVPQTAFTLAANQASILQAERNAQMPSPGLTMTHSIGGCIIKEDEDLLPVPVAAASLERRWQSQQAFAGVHNASGGSGDASTVGSAPSPAVTMTSCVITKAPVVTTKVVSPAGGQTPMKVTVSKPQLAAGSAQKLILVNAGHNTAAASAGGSATPGKSLTSQAVTLTKPVGGAGFPSGALPKTSVVYPASQAHSPAAASGAGAGSANSVVVQQQQLQSAYPHSLTIARPRPKTVAGPSVAAIGSAGAAAQSISITTTSAPRLRVPGPAALSPTVATSVVHPKPGGGGTIVATAGPQPVSPAAGTPPRSSIVTSAISITAKPGIQIKQEGAMKIITSSTSKQLLPKAAGSAPPIVVVTSTAASAQSAVTAGSTVNATVVRSITAGGQVQVSGGKVISLGGCKVGPAGSSAASASSPGVSAASPAAGASSSSLVSSGKAGASIIAQATSASTAGNGGFTVAKTPASPILSVTRTSPASAQATVATTVASGTSPAMVKGCTVIVQNQPHRQAASVAAAAAASSSSSPAASSALPLRPVKAGEGTTAHQHTPSPAEQSVLASAAAAGGTTAIVTTRTEARPPASAAAASRVEGAAELSLVARPSILAGLMQSDPAATAASSHIIMDQVACEGIGAPAGGEVWLLTSDGGGSDQAAAVAPAEADSGSHVDGAENVAETGAAAVDASGASPRVGSAAGSGGQAQAPPQFDIFSSALAEAQIDLDPYEYSDDVSTTADDTVTTWTTTVAPQELITAVEGLALHSSDTGGCIVSDGASALLAGTETCVAAGAVAEYQEVSEDFVEAISQCAAAAGEEGVTMAVIDDCAGPAATTAASERVAGFVLDACPSTLAASDTADDAIAGISPPGEQPLPPPGAGSELQSDDGGSNSAGGYDVLQMPNADISESQIVLVVGDVPCQGADNANGAVAECADLPPVLAEQNESPSCAAAAPAAAAADSPIAEQAARSPAPHTIATASALSSSSVAAVSCASTPDGGDVSESMQPLVWSPSTSATSFPMASEASSSSSSSSGGSEAVALTPRAARGPAVAAAVAAAGDAAVSSTAGRCDESAAVQGAVVIAQRKRRATDLLASDESLATSSASSSSSSWVKAALGLMHKVMKFRGANRNKGEHNASAWFLRPVTDDEAPGYSTVVTTPMDFGTIKKKLETGMYASGGAGIGEFHADVLLVQTNCGLYNPPEHCVRRDCDEVMAYYEREFERTFGRTAMQPLTSALGVGQLTASSAARSAVSAEQVLSPKRMRMLSDDSGSAPT